VKTIDPPLGLDIALPRSGSRRRQQAIHAQLRQAVLDGRLKAGLRLPASRALAQSLGVARITVVAAYDMLVAEGYLVARRGAGTFVAETRAQESAPAPRMRAHRPPPFSPLARPDIRPVYASEGPRPEIDFTIGVPDVRELRFDVWNRLASRAMRQYCRQGSAYGDPQGSSLLRRAISEHVSFSRAVAATEDTVVVTSGAQQAIALLAHLFVEPGRTTVAIEDPGYPPARVAFAAAGAKLADVPVDPEGLVVARIPHDARLIYVTPSHQFPLGMVMTKRRRVALLDFAARHDAVIVEDDYDSDFRFSGRPLDALQTVDRHQRVFYVGTFSKSLFPGLRLGFIVAPPWAVDALVAAKHRADWHGDLIAQETLAAFISEGHLLRHLRRMRRVYASRREALLAALKGLDPWLRAITSEAGLHLAAMSAPGLDAARFGQAARAVGVGIYPVRSDAAASAAQPYVLFGFGRTEASAIGPAIGRLRHLLASGESETAFRAAELAEPRHLDV
jgi:GntR family transcriptional regulator/MocR family aminotransferase